MCFFEEGLKENISCKTDDSVNNYALECTCFEVLYFERVCVHSPNARVFHDNEPNCEIRPAANYSGATDSAGLFRRCEGENALRCHGDLICRTFTFRAFECPGQRAGNFRVFSLQPLALHIDPVTGIQMEFFAEIKNSSR